MKKVVSPILLLLFFAACKKEHADTICLDAAVKWGGEPAADGFGWYIFDSVGGIKNYIPLNLPDGLKIDGLSVHVCMYETTEKFYCMCPQPMNKYHITQIRRN
jgi:hypothetical protein